MSRRSHRQEAAATDRHNAAVIAAHRSKGAVLARSDMRSLEAVLARESALLDVLRVVSYDLEDRMAKDPGWRPRSLTRVNAALESL